MTICERSLPRRDASHGKKRYKPQHEPARRKKRVVLMRSMFEQSQEGRS
jgi:hypothetical protein